MHIRVKNRQMHHYYWIQPSGLRSSINACSSLPAGPLGGAAVHWRERAAFTSRTRDRQSSYNPQPWCVRAHSKRGSAISRRPVVDSRSDARCVLACLPREGHGHFQRDLWNHPHHPLSSRHPTRPAAAILGRECNICAALAIRRVCSAPRRRGSPSRTNTLRPGGARRDPRCESVGGARVPALSGTAAGAERAQIRPPRVKEGGSDTAKRCFRGPHELAFIPSNIFIYPQFASRVK